ncbi:MAG: hypothetical protein Q9220_006861 [cf. Caloplaca sp. 1 TL-2023]
MEARLLQFVFQEGGWHLVHRLRDALPLMPAQISGNPTPLAKGFMLNRRAVLINYLNEYMHKDKDCRGWRVHDVGDTESISSTKILNYENHTKLTMEARLLQFFRMNRGWSLQNDPTDAIPLSSAHISTNPRSIASQPLLDQEFMLFLNMVMHEKPGCRMWKVHEIGEMHQVSGRDYKLVINVVVVKEMIKT